ncbi:MAG: phosphoribosylaminoimidazolesuccinocarboxamide synthase [Phycisphaerae bacterium]
MTTIIETQIPGVSMRRGKVRDIYDLGTQLLIVATDRISAFDVILPTAIPDKGIILTALSNFWFKLFAPHIEHHLLSTRPAEFPAAFRAFRAQLAGRSVLVRKTAVIPIECVVRGYLAGGGWKEYQKTGAVCGVKLPPGLMLSQQLPEPIFTPTTKAETGHDESITFDQACDRVGGKVMMALRATSLNLYKIAAAAAYSRGIIVADTKFEFGIDPKTGRPILIDEVITPDSSRFWPLVDYKPGLEQVSFDKQYVRNYLETLHWNKRPPGPTLPADVVANTRRKYLEALKQLAGDQANEIRLSLEQQDVRLAGL